MITSFRYSKLWLVYFIATIALIGLVLAYGITVPLYLLGRIFPKLEKKADQTLCFAIHLLLQIQPWFLPHIELNLPTQEAIQSQAILFVSNHRSHLDAFILLSKIPGIRIFAKRSLLFIPFLGLMMRLSRQIPAERGDLSSYLKALEVVRYRLKNGEKVHIFPEMKRCSQAYCGTQEFSTAPFQIAIQEKAVIIPIVFIGTDEVWPKGKIGLRFRYPINVRGLRPIYPAEFSSASELTQEVKRRINKELS